VANPEGNDPEIHANHAGCICIPVVSTEASGDAACDASVVCVGDAATGLVAPVRSTAHAKSPTRTATVATKIRRRSRVPDRLVICPG